ncbi:formylmethanofuran dehydrogenase subunit C [Rhodopirellula bahusiensis]|uniref:Formylmethanofuran dehydrogenase subunit C n=1 Tax=Rhodopirellula bahusiensis TaxID=2014065 RepID=A0A2G1W0E3_9BACT|nr:formylmethanofuran dehydrogenase subunit C [Rhodopirellula bahusiensis]PHQ32487.1 formylmethanofuran dehydrogenase subunit C [Rhodopirellula bahusiensis]
MSKITLRLRSDLQSPLDASSIRLDEWVQLSIEEIERFELRSQSGPVAIGDLFEVSVQSDVAMPRLVIDGCLRLVSGIGFQHKLGEIVCQSNVGDHAGSCMLGGRIVVHGNAGDHLGSPMGSRNVGMNGGQLIVNGSAGDDAGHRMRRGELWIDGDVGTRLATWQVAGTIGVAGNVGPNIAYGMRRGTLIFGRQPTLDANRFSTPIPLRSAFVSLLGRNCQASWLTPEFLKSLRVCRGDRQIDGRGEIWMP